MSNKIVLESISYLDCQENMGSENKQKSSKISAKDLNSVKASHRKTTSALVRNADALFDITNSPPSTPKKTVVASTPTSTPIKSTATTTSTTKVNDNPFQNSILDGTSLSPKSSRYTIAATPTKIGSSSTSSSNATPTMMTLTHNQAQQQPTTPVSKGFFSTPKKPDGEKKLKKRQLEKEYQMLQDKIKIMEKIRNDTDSDVERMKISLIDTMTDNARLQKRVSELEQTIEEMKAELDKGSYEAWKGYCSLQDSPPGVSSRYTKKRAINQNLNSNNL